VRAEAREAILVQPMMKSKMRSESMKPYQRQFIEFALNKQYLSLANLR
jgi:hypothetical protein